MITRRVKVNSKQLYDRMVRLREYIDYFVADVGSGLGTVDHYSNLKRILLKGQKPK